MRPNIIGIKIWLGGHRIEFENKTKQKYQKHSTELSLWSVKQFWQAWNNLATLFQIHVPLANPFIILPP